MTERDEYGYVLKIVGHSPYHPWSKITTPLAQGLNGYREKPSTVSSVGIFTPKFGMGSLENPKMVGAGEVDAGITNPCVTAKLAMEGTGPYSKSVGELRAIARFPEPDFIFWLVSEKSGIRSMEDIPKKKMPITLISGRKNAYSPDPITWAIEEVIKQYGFSYDDIESWGGKVLFPGPATVGVPMFKRGESDALFQEGAHNPMWDDLAEALPLRSLPLERRVVDYMVDKYGFFEATVKKGRLKGITEDHLTLDYGGWLLFCRADLSDELAYLLAKVSFDQRERIAGSYKNVPEYLRGLEYPMTAQHLCTKCVIPLHRGAEKFYKEIGAL